MIPFLFVNIKQFKKVITFKFPWYRYLTAAGLYYLYYEIFTTLYSRTNTYVDFDLKNPYLYIGSYIFLFNYIMVYLSSKITNNIPNSLQDSDITTPTEEEKDKISVVIPCYNAHDVIKESLQSALQHFKKENIFVSENSNSQNITNKTTKNICHELGVNYLYVPRGNKTNAFRSAMNFVKTEYVITLDDDTCFPEKFRPNLKLFEEDQTIGAQGFMILMKSTERIIERLIQQDYINFCFVSNFANYSSGKFVTGICGIYRTKLVRLLSQTNPAGTELSFGEDSSFGVGLRLNGYRIVHDIQNFVYSFCPTRFYYSIYDILPCIGKIKQISGYNSTNMHVQRIRWGFSALARLPYEIFLFFTYFVKGDNIIQTILKNIHYRYTFLITFYLYLCPFLLFLSISELLFCKTLQLIDGCHERNPYNYITVLTTLYLTCVLMMISNRLYVFRNREEFKPTIGVIFLYSLYTTYNCFVFGCGYIGSLIYYIPFEITMKYYNNIIYNLTYCKGVFEENKQNVYKYKMLDGNQKSVEGIYNIIYEEESPEVTVEEISIDEQICIDIISDGE
jgi:hypothetical protein